MYTAQPEDIGFAGQGIHQAFARLRWSLEAREMSRSVSSCSRITGGLLHKLNPIGSTIHVHKIEPPFRDRLSSSKLTNEASL